MVKFLFVYRMKSDSGNVSPEETQQTHEKWRTWITQALEQGWMINAGDALQKEGRVVNAKKVVLDGPFIEAKEVVGGFSIVEADTLDAAAELAKGCPVFLRGGSVEVRPLWEFNMGK